VVLKSSIPQYYEVAKPSPSYAGHPTLVSLGATIRAERLAQKMSQEALANKAEIDRSYVGGIERGEQNIAIINLQKIADALNVRLSKLVE
jgi:ribosome-binding protein aMBF1 (putative translation factor)